VHLAADHPWAREGELTSERYLEAAHVVPMPYPIDQRGVVAPGLGTMHVSRDRRVQCPDFSLAPSRLGPARGDAHLDSKLRLLAA
jgi:hypothetical protein